MVNTFAIGSPFETKFLITAAVLLVTKPSASRTANIRTFFSGKSDKPKLADKSDNCLVTTADFINSLSKNVMAVDLPALKKKKKSKKRSKGN